MAYPILEREKVVNGLGYRQPYPATEWFRKRGLILHDGMDIAAKKECRNEKITVTAPVEGQVIWADWQDRDRHDVGFGLYIILLFLEKATYTVELFYLAHLQELFVSAGMRVKKSTRLALMGSSGYSTAKHTHVGRKVLMPYGKLVTANPKAVF